MFDSTRAVTSTHRRGSTSWIVDTIGWTCQHPRMRASSSWLPLLLCFACTPSTPTPSATKHDAVTEAPSAGAAPAPPAHGETHSLVTYEDIVRSPAPGTKIPRSIRFSPDDAALTFLYSTEDSTHQELYRFDLTSNERTRLVEPPGGGVTEDNLSLEEQLRRERSRNRATGIPRYAWSKAGERILIPLSSGVYVQDGVRGTLREVVPVADGPAVLDPRFSPTGESIAFVRDAELYVVPSAGGTPKQVTSGARGTGKTNGLAEYIAQEEMGRSEGYWWSHDGQMLAFAQVDEQHIPTYPIVHQGKDSPGPDAREEHRYPFAGTDNAKVRLGVVSAKGGSVRWLEFGTDEERYLARVDWLPDDRLAVQLENRDQTQLDLMFYNVRSGRSETILTEHSDTWINLHDMLYPLDEVTGEAAGGFVWGSERNGYQHLYLYNADGQLVRALTSGEWKITGVEGIDQQAGIVYFTATKESPLERHLYAVGLDGKEIRKITTRSGSHGITLDHAKKRFVDVHSSIDAPPTVTVRSLADDRELASVPLEPDAHLDRMKLRPPELVQVESRDGETLHGAVYRPPSSFGTGPWPIVVSVYGGPHAQRVTDSWGMTVDLRAQYLRNHGYLVFKLDNRGSNHRGLAFEGKIKHDLGNIEVQDQVDGVRWLEARKLGKPGGAAIYGWSYGGYMSAMALARAPETFTVGIAGAPVTHWDGYDTHYTERYMGTPANNTKGYEESSVMHHADGMTGKLLLVHGLIDENVHFRHTARLINALIAADKDYDLLLFPDARHGPRKDADRVYLERRTFEFIDRNLQ